jgi:DNA helicase HerA-like ATPase
LTAIGADAPKFAACPVVLWDVFGDQGHPVRATVSDLGPLLLSRILDLNETQEGVLALVFKVADDNGLLLLDLKDLRAMLQYVGDNAQQFQTNYGNVSAASIGAIQRGLLGLEQQGAEKFIGEPMLNVDDLLQTSGGKGVINILAADKLMNAPKLYSTMLVAVRAPRAAAGSGRPREAEAWFSDEAHLLPMPRAASGQDREGRGLSAPKVWGLFRHAEPARRAGDRPRSAGTGCARVTGRSRHATRKRS